METRYIVMLAILAVLIVAYLMRRRARISREDMD